MRRVCGKRSQGRPAASGDSPAGCHFAHSHMLRVLAMPIMGARGSSALKPSGWMKRMPAPSRTWRVTASRTSGVKWAFQWKPASRTSS